jgi:chromosome segregation ATPase
MARGITQEQVNAAADTILGAGENPTVEKVRAALGTGSPNTITRMLDTWRGQLGERLRQLNALPELPGSVGQAMIELWRLASEQAEHTLTNRFADQQAALDAARADLIREREGWEARLQAAETRIAQAQVARNLAEHACATLDSQLQDSHALRADLVQQRDRLQESHDRQLAEIQALRTRHHESQVALQIERERLEAHMRAVEDRAHQEIDRARQDAKQWQQRHEVAERSRREAIDTAQKRYDATSSEARHLEQEVARQAGQITALEKALSEAYAAAPPKRTSRAAPKASEPSKRKRTAARPNDKQSRVKR